MIMTGTTFLRKRTGVCQQNRDEMWADRPGIRGRNYVAAGQQVAPPGRVDHDAQSNYSYYMKPVELKVARIGNSRGVRIPAGTLERYRIGTSVVMEERSDGILLRPHGPAVSKLSWEDTASAMAAAAEDWNTWDMASGDGLDDIVWEPERTRRVAEKKSTHETRRRPRKP